MEYSLLKFKEPKRRTDRKILHIDMDAFYASVEIRENEKLRHLPVIIGPDPRENGGHGVVATASYVARQYGVHSAMSAEEALRKCPEGIFIRPNFERYRQISHQIHDIFKEYTSVIQPLALDEAYLDVTHNRINEKSAIKIGRQIQYEIYDKLQLTSSVGVSYNKFLAKVASDYHKPAGFTVITPDQAEIFLLDLPIEAFIGVGTKTKEKMVELEIKTGRDLLAWTQVELAATFGKFGRTLYKRVRGIDDRPVVTHHVRKSLGKEKTYIHEMKTDKEILGQLQKMSQDVYASLKKDGLHGKTVVLKYRYRNFDTYTRRKTCFEYIASDSELFLHVMNLWREFGDVTRGVRLLGVTISTLDPIYYENIPLDLHM
ncbi:DNA polymerase IV [Allofustis seminis]|uniref:DNA polymerase IV n=1 Tax=Allofustis seminis TaxID=166939 RepID=UPI000380A27A|nr:DNA polymerase IV [Allofustis seminis]